MPSGKAKHKGKPIILSMSEVQAVLRGHKTSIRRIIEPPFRTNKGQYESFSFRGFEDDMGVFVNGKDTQYRRVGWVAGEKLWVQEGWAQVQGKGIVYKADANFSIKPAPKWKHPSRMENMYSRMLLHVKEVRGEELHKISEEDALREGIYKDLICPGEWGYVVLSDSDETADSAVEAYQRHWGHRFKEYGGLAWDKNPMVWVTVFEPEVVQ